METMIQQTSPASEMSNEGATETSSTVSDWWIVVGAVLCVAVFFPSWTLDILNWADPSVGEWWAEYRGLQPSHGEAHPDAPVGSSPTQTEYNPPPSPPQPSEYSPPTPPAPPPSSPSVTPQFGESFRVGAFTYVVERVEAPRQLGRYPVQRHPNPGAAFVVVRFLERNDGAETAHGFGPPMVLRDLHGREFRPDSRVMTVLIMSGVQNGVLSELQPGIDYPSVAGFEVPVGILTEGYELVVTGRGFRGVSPVVIPLRAEQ